MTGIEALALAQVFLRRLGGEEGFGSGFDVCKAELLRHVAVAAERARPRRKPLPVGISVQNMLHGSAYPASLAAQIAFGREYEFSTNFSGFFIAMPDKFPHALFMSVLGVPEYVAQALCSCGHTSIEEVAYVPVRELLATPGVPEWLLLDIRDRARSYLMEH